MNCFGVVTRVGMDKNGSPFARIRPLYEAVDGPWRAIAPEEFPLEGSAFWPNAREALEGSLVFFRAVENQNERTKMRAADVKQAVEVIKVANNKDMEAVGEELRAGAAGPAEFPGGRALLACGLHDLVGPVKLKKEETGRLLLDAPNLDRVPRYVATALKLRTFTVSGVTRCVLNGPLPGGPAGYVDWDEDKLVARRAVAWAVRQVNSNGTQLTLVKRQIDEVADQIVAAADGADGGLERFRLERTRRLLNSAGTSSRVAGEVIDELKHLSWVTDGLKEEVKALREEERAKLRAELESENSAVATARRARAKVETGTRGARRKAFSGEGEGGEAGSRTPGGNGSPA